MSFDATFCLEARAQKFRAGEKGTASVDHIVEHEAVYLGCVSAVQRLQRRGRLSRRQNLCAVAARTGNLEELKSLRENGCPWDASTCSRAAQGWHLEVIKWARANNCLWDENACSEAAEGGHLEVVQWLRANGCGMWNEEFLCTGAAKGGHLEVLQWLRANGCPWDDWT